MASSKLLLGFCVFITLSVTGQVNLTNSDVPIVRITTENSEPVQDDPHAVAHMGVINNGTGVRNYMSDSHNGYDGRIKIEGRSSASQQYPQKGHGLETQFPKGSNVTVSVLGLPVENASFTGHALMQPADFRVIVYHLAVKEVSSGDRGKFSGKHAVSTTGIDSVAGTCIDPVQVDGAPPYSGKIVKIN